MITTAAPAIAALVRTVAYMPDGAVVLPGLARPTAMPREEWDALGPDEDGRGEETHPQFHLKLLLDRLGVAPHEAVMVGDRMDTDVISGMESGMSTVLVLSGVSTPETLRTYAYRPSIVLDGVGDIPALARGEKR